MTRPFPSDQAGSISGTQPVLPRLRVAKLALNAFARVDLDSGLLIETLAQAICYDSDFKQEGTTAFLEKQKPKFTER